MTAPTVHGPFATAEAFQTLKTRPREYMRILLSYELGQRAFNHLTEVTR